MQITAKGQPVIYYGEEIGLTGANDYPRQSNRYDYDWTKADDSNGTYVHYKKMLEIRKNYSAVFARGDRKVVMASNDSGYDVISRSYDNTTLYVGMNIRDAEQTLEIPVKSSGITAYTDVYSGQEYTIAQDKVQVKIPAASKGGTVVLVPSGFSDGLIAPRIVNLPKGKTTSLPSKLTLSKSDGTKTLVDVTYSVQGVPDGVSMDAAGVKITVSEAFQGTQLELEASSSEARVRFAVKVVEDNNKITLRLHYGRKANPNEDLNVWIWRAGKAGERFEVEDDTDPENPNGVVTVGEFEGRAVSSVGYIIRNGGDKGDGVTEDRFIDLSTVLSGTVDFYVTPGKTDGRLVLGEDVFYGTKVRSVTYNSNTNSILVETTEEPVNVNVENENASQKVYADENATQQQIDEAVNNLMKACGSLTVKPAPEPEEEVKEGLCVKWAPDAGLTHGTDGKYHIQYTGKAIKPTILVYDGKVRLKEKTDYTITYKANTNAGEASVIVRGKGNYTEARTEHFTIDKVNLAYLEIADLYGAVKANNTKQIAPKPTVKYNGKTLRLNRDYTAAYNNSADGRTPGIYSVKLTANSNNQNFTGSATIQMILADKDKQVLMSRVRIGKISPQKYEMDKTTGRGKVQKPSVSVKYKGRELTQKDGSKNQESWDYEILWDEIHTEAGETAVITIRGRGTDYVGTKTVSFKISGTPLKASAVTWKSMPKSGLSYNGAKQEPAVAVKGASASQYTVEYSNNINAGTATAVIHGRNGYEGTVKKTFKIAPYDLGANTDNRFTFGENRQITTAIPYAKGGSRLDDATLKARFTVPGTERTIPLEQGRDYSLTYTKNKAVGTAAVTIKGKGNFKGTIKKIPFTIVKQNLSALSEMSFAEDLLVKNASKYNRTIPKIIDRDGKALKNKVDFTVDRSTAYKDAGGNPITGSLAVGQVIYVTAKGKGNYEGELSIPFRVIANEDYCTENEISS